MHVSTTSEKQFDDSNLIAYYGGVKRGDASIVFKIHLRCRCQCADLVHIPALRCEQQILVGLGALLTCHAAAAA